MSHKLIVRMNEVGQGVMEIPREKRGWEKINFESRRVHCSENVNETSSLDAHSIFPISY